MALYGKNLAASIRTGTTYRQATDALGAVEHAINGCYSSLSLWQNWKERGTLDTINLAILSAVVPEDAQAMRETLDAEFTHLATIDTMVQDDGARDGWETPVPSEPPNDLLFAVKGSVETASSAVALCDDLFHTSFATQVSDAIVPVVGNLGDELANTLSAFLGNFLAGIWWILVLAAAVLYVIYGRKAGT